MSGYMKACFTMISDKEEAAKERIELIKKCFEPVSDKLEADKTLVLGLDLNRYRIKKERRIHKHSSGLSEAFYASFNLK